MVSTILTHVIGIAALLAVLTIVIMYVGFNTQVMTYENAKRNLEYVSQVVALQVLYAVSANSNTTISLEYPITVGFNQYYNVYIGYGYIIKEKIPELSQLNNTWIYVVAALPDKSAYASTPVVNETYLGKTVVIPGGVIVIGSGTICKLRITTNSTTILINITNIEVRTG